MKLQYKIAILTIVSFVSFYDTGAMQGQQISAEQFAKDAPIRALKSELQRKLIQLSDEYKDDFLSIPGASEAMLEKHWSRATDFNPAYNDVYVLKNSLDNVTRWLEQAKIARNARLNK